MITSPENPDRPMDAHATSQLAHEMADVARAMFRLLQPHRLYAKQPTVPQSVEAPPAGPVSAQGPAAIEVPTIPVPGGSTIAPPASPAPVEAIPVPEPDPAVHQQSIPVPSAAPVPAAIPVPAVPALTASEPPTMAMLSEIGFLDD